VTAFPQNLILSKEHSLNTTHETTPFTVQVTVDFLLKGGLVKVSGTDCHAESDGFFFRFTGDVLEDSERGVDTSAFFKERADGTAGTLGGDEDNVNVRGRNNAGEVLVDNGKPVREVEGLALGEERLDFGPRLTLSSILSLVCQAVDLIRRASS
jgi:hypothetical protein